MVWVTCGGWGSLGTACCGAPGTRVQTAETLVAQLPLGRRAKGPGRPNPAAARHCLSLPPSAVGKLGPRARKTPGHRPRPAAIWGRVSRAAFPSVGLCHDRHRLEGSHPGRLLPGTALGPPALSGLCPTASRGGGTGFCAEPWSLGLQPTWPCPLATTRGCHAHATVPGLPLGPVCPWPTSWPPTVQANVARKAPASTGSLSSMGQHRQCARG